MTNDAPAGRPLCHDPTWITASCGGWLAPGLPKVDITPAAARAFFRKRGSLRALATFRDGFHPRSRAAGVAFFVLALNEFRAGRLSPMHFAHLSAGLWVEGKQTTALREFGLEAACPPGWLLFQIARYRVSAAIMSPAALAQFDQLPDPFPAWRGGENFDGELWEGHSWTISREVAEGFAKRAGPDGEVIEQQVHKAHVVAYFPDRAESEVIVCSPETLRFYRPMACDADLTDIAPSAILERPPRGFPGGGFA